MAAWRRHVRGVEEGREGAWRRGVGGRVEKGAGRKGRAFLLIEPLRPWIFYYYPRCHSIE